MLLAANCKKSFILNDTFDLTIVANCLRDPPITFLESLFNSPSELKMRSGIAPEMSYFYTWISAINEEFNISAMWHPQALYQVICDFRSGTGRYVQGFTYYGFSYRFSIQRQAT